MFKIEFFVDDKNLPQVLRDVGGKVMNLSVVPVVNAKITEPPRQRGPHKTNGVVRQDAANTLALFLKEAKKLVGSNPIRAAEAQNALSKAGLSPTSYSHFLQQAVKAGMIKRVADPETNKNVHWAWV